MPNPAWGEDGAADEAIIAVNVGDLLTALLIVALSRVTPTVSLAHDWQGAIYAGVSSVPASHYLGEPRGSADADLADYEVELVDPLTGRLLAQGVPASDVARELAEFETAIRTAVANLDAVIPAGQPPATSAQLVAAVELAAIVHAEWVRIHPYANGNGRIARTWANWVATRYGLPPFVRIRPRPDGLLYGLAAQRSMGRPPDFRGDHALTVSVFLDLLRQKP
jgi:Fic/DOC family